MGFDWENAGKSAAMLGEKFLESQAKKTSEEAAKKVGEQVVASAGENSLSVGTSAAINAAMEYAAAVMSVIAWVYLAYCIADHSRCGVDK